MQELTLAYPARFAKDGDGFVVTFRDVPEAITQGDDLTEALANAEEALSVALAGYLKLACDLPAASAAKRTERVIHAAPALVAKVALRRALDAQGLSAADLARRLGVDHKEARRLLDPDHPSKLHSLDLALRAVGQRAVLHVMAIDGERRSA
jgi:antitoxin HicB